MSESVARSIADESPPAWELPIAGRPRLGFPAAIMGVVNATPDSFSDGGRHLDPTAAIAAGRAQAEAGAAWVDVGGESSRPGAEPVPAAVEIERVVQVIAGLAAGVGAARISVDTCKAAVATAACAAGATMVNDISAGADRAMFATVAEAGAALCLMHMQGTPQTMQRAPRYADVVDEVIAFLHERMRAAIAAGIDERALVVDPGIGFGKRPAHNLALLRGCARIGRATGRPVVIGVSRKSLIPALTGRDLPPAARDSASHALHALLALRCSLLRVHDVAGALDAIRLAAALQPSGVDTL